MAKDKKVKKAEKKPTSDSELLEESKEAAVADEANKASAEESEKQDRNGAGLKEEKGTLMLRYFMNDERTGKILTRLKRKVYFPVDPNLKPGWYIATIVEANETYGVMDTMSLEQVPVHLWHRKHICGIFIERDHKANVLKIFPAIPREYLEEQAPTCIFEVKLPEPKYKQGATIGEIIAAKEQSGK